MNRRTVLITVIVVLVAAGGYYLTYLQRVGKTAELLAAIIAADHKEAAQAMEQLGVRGVQLYPKVLDLAQGQDPEVEWRSAVMLGELGNSPAADVLSGMLDDSDATVRAAAAQALGRVKGQDAAAALARLVGNEAEELVVRISAVQALGTLAAEEAVPQLKQALTYQPIVAEGEPDNSWQLRVAAAGALGAIGTAEAIDALAERVAASGTEPGDIRERTAVAYALGDALSKGACESGGALRGFEALVEAAQDEIGDVRMAAVDSLQRVSPPEGQDSKADSVLEQAGRDPHYWVRQAAGE